FSATPGAYSFGVCAVASSDPHCTVDPATVPKVMDVLGAAGTQSNQLDYTLHNQVVLQPVLMP
ncbi:MAG TPA: hypothetical protein VIJ07_21250, partial [Dermatophilaceae bacterium]